MTFGTSANVLSAAAEELCEKKDWNRGAQVRVIADRVGV